jgi:hypothetical protein
MKTVFQRARRERFAAARRYYGPHATPGQLVREPQRLALAPAPTAFGIHVHHAKSHAAQLPLSPSATQGA